MKQERKVAKGRPEFDIERCKGCELCIGACPEQILVISDNYNSQGHRYPECVEPEKCTACTFCAIICPDMVISVWRYSRDEVKEA
jgi:2-oxoglutarate ferredoxin oxidoreductase subunit delta